MMGVAMDPAEKLRVLQDWALTQSRAVRAAQMAEQNLQAQADARLEIARLAEDRARAVAYSRRRTEEDAEQREALDCAERYFAGLRARIAPETHRPGTFTVVLTWAVAVALVVVVVWRLVS